MGGLSFSTRAGEPIAFAGLGFAQRRLLQDSMKAAGVAWKLGGKYCPDCLYAEITKEGAHSAFASLLVWLQADPKRLLKGWTKTLSQRDALLSIIEALDEAIGEVPDPVLLLVDELKACEHPRMGQPAAPATRKKKT